MVGKCIERKYDDYLKSGSLLYPHRAEKKKTPTEPKPTDW
jgi:hypothetical protein